MLPDCVEPLLADVRGATRGGLGFVYQSHLQQLDDALHFLERTVLLEARQPEAVCLCRAANRGPPRMGWIASFVECCDWPSRRSVPDERKSVAVLPNRPVQ
jgi:hypothetical protein